ncbi:hypothetical protein Sjap_022027 [Stephania japonica]|uniref:Uncharacterized protein n=1 Tax=Stephania japonica TaxID=461633 RepID=A0AAP0EQP9_9MAGN
MNTSTNLHKRRLLDSKGSDASSNLLGGGKSYHNDDINVSPASQPVCLRISNHGPSPPNLYHGVPDLGLPGPIKPTQEYKPGAAEQPLYSTGMGEQLFPHSAPGRPSDWLARDQSDGGDVGTVTALVGSAG